MVNNIALISQSTAVSQGDAMTVAAAIQKQVTRDFGPLWNIDATVACIATLDQVPVGFWPVIVVDTVATGDLGIHGQRNRQPIAFVEAVTGWSQTASHEILEMLADPYANRLVPGDSVAGDGSRVEYLTEVCDPCQDPQFSYLVDGVTVSDFYTPQFFDATGTTGARYDFVGAMSHPRQVLEGGYLSWHDPVSNHLFRADMIESQLYISDLGDVPDTAVSLRSHIDRRPSTLSKRQVEPYVVERVSLPSYARSVNHAVASKAKAGRLKSDFESLRKK